MTVPSYTVYSGRPRVWFRDTDRTALVARTNDASGWKPLWDNTITPAANDYDDDSDSAVAGVSAPNLRWAVLAYWGWIEEGPGNRPAGGKKDKAIKAAVYLANNDPPTPTNAYERNILLGLTFVFDTCFDVMTSSERTLISGQMHTYCLNMSTSAAEEMDGWSGIDSMCLAAAALANHGFHSGAQAQLDRAMSFFWGSGANNGRIAMARYQYADGGAEKGGQYLQLGAWGELQFLWHMKSGTSLDPWTTEASWLSKMYEWILWDQYRGQTAQDFGTHGDTNKVSSPPMLVELRWMLGILATKYPNTGGLQGGQMLRWLYDEFDGFQAPYADNMIFDPIFLDRAAVSPVAPSAATTPPSTKRLFKPPGVFWFSGAPVGESALDYEESTRFRVNAKTRFWNGHFHLDSGSVQITHRGDVLLQAPAGYYGSDTDTCPTCHYSNALQRTWLHSLAPCVVDPSQSYHRQAIVSSQLSVNDGGQHWRKFVNGGTTEYDPNNVYDMQNDAGGAAWLRCAKFDKIFDTADMVAVRADIREGYRKYHTDPHRCEILEVKYLFIPPTAGNGLTNPAMLYYARVRKTDPDWRVVIPLHSYQAWAATAYGVTSTGYNTAASLLPAGKLWVDVRSIGSYTFTNSTPGTLDSLGYGANQFKMFGAGTNFKPVIKAANERSKRDLKRNSYFWERTTKVQEEHYVALFMVTDAGASEPATGRAWATDGEQPNHYAITIGSSTYMLHRTLDSAAFGGTADTTAPAEVTSHTVTPQAESLVSRWVEPVDGDYAEAEVEYRTSAT